MYLCVGRTSVWPYLNYGMLHPSWADLVHTPTAMDIQGYLSEREQKSKWEENTDVYFTNCFQSLACLGALLCIILLFINTNVCSTRIWFFFSFFSFTLQEFYKRDLQPSFPHHLTISKSSSQTVIYHSVHYLLSFFNNLFISTCVYFLQWVTL